MTNHPADSDTKYLIIDPDQLATDTLVSLAREFVFREQANDDTSGSDLDRLVNHAVDQIKAKKLLITFDAETESVGVIDDVSLKKQLRAQPDRSGYESL